MIYLFDDKKSRQEDYGWDYKRLKIFSNKIHPIYSLSEFEKDELDKGQLFKGNNVILVHESFFDASDRKKEANEIRSKLSHFDNPNLKIAYFSGSKSSRKVDGNIAHLPVSYLYQNLESFLNNSGEGKYNLSYLLFGDNYQIEQELTKNLEKANNEIEEKIDDASPKSKNFIALDFQNEIEEVFENARYETFFLKDEYDNSVSDEYLADLVKKWFQDIRYDNIFIPISFGPTLSDFNGLRMACHIRCTKTVNQLTKIFIYSYASIDKLLNHSCFNILKTDNVKLIQHNISSFADALNDTSAPLTESKLPKTIAQLKLDHPKNYEDSHSIANEWAIYRWANAIGAYDTDIEKVVDTVKSQLYFKYLQTTNKQSYSDEITENELKINYQGSPKILYIDDEAEKGWYEIFCKILSDFNELDFEHLDDEFDEKSSDEIVDICLKKIKADDIDVVILDFRLHRDDFNTKSTDQITSLQLLKRIKEFNPGIQVVIFSATEKVWNHLALQKAGADGFIRKTHADDVLESIQDLLTVIGKNIKNAQWLKPIWSRTDELIDHLHTQSKKKAIDKDFAGAIITYLELSFDSLHNESVQYPYDTAFVYYFLILEALSKQLIDEENPIKIEFIDGKGNEKTGYNFQFRKNYDYLKDFTGNWFTRTNKGDQLITTQKRIPYNEKFHNLIGSVGVEGINPVHLVKLRNNFSHPDLIENRRIAEITKEDCKQLFEVCYRLIKQF